jgi:hypothetical protein
MNARPRRRGKLALARGGVHSHIEGIVDKLPKTKVEIQGLLTAELRTFADCEDASEVEVIAIETEDGGPNWTVSGFNRGRSDIYACDRALQHIVPAYQRIYELAQKH